jgi:uncharacterized protein
MATDELEGKTALVTGASSGLGAAFARDLAARGASLVITARRAGNLEALAKELRDRHGVAVEVIALDLAAPGAPAELHARTEGAGRSIDVLVNNAGGGIHQYFVETAWDRVAKQIQLNVVALTELTHLFTRAMLARGRGHVLNVASVGAYSPTPSFATYSATKAFVRDFTEALAHELRATDVRVCCVCPGLTRSEFREAAGASELSPAVAATMMSAEDCVAIGLDALFAGRRNVITGILNKIGMWLLRFLPRRTIVWSAALAMGAPPSADRPRG